MKRRMKKLIKSLVVGLMVSALACTGVKAPEMDIHTAVVTGNMDAIKKHIDVGTDLNQKDTVSGSTPLISSIVFGKSDIAELLIDAGADVNETNADGSSPVYVAAFFCRTETLKKLLTAHADKNIPNKFGSTALEVVTIPFAAVKPVYDVFSVELGPLGLRLDYDRIQQERPAIAKILK